MSNQAAIRTKRIVWSTARLRKHWREIVVGEDTTFVFNLPIKLQHIDVSYFGGRNNRLANINFTNGNNVEYVNVAGIKFKNCRGHFRGLPSLKTLIISDFNCSSLDLNMIRNFSNLRRFVCRNTFLGVGLKGDITGIFLENLTNLEIIDFSDKRSMHTFLFWT